MWNSFATVLNEIDLFSWADRYDDPSICDGTYWHVTLSWNGRDVESNGANRFPVGFDRFCAAVRNLFGGLAYT
jgi:hypothetical protein